MSDEIKPTVTLGWQPKYHLIDGKMVDNPDYVEPEPTVDSDDEEDFEPEVGSVTFHATGGASLHTEEGDVPLKPGDTVVYRNDGPRFFDCCLVKITGPNLDAFKVTYKLNAKLGLAIAKIIDHSEPSNWKKYDPNNWTVGVKYVEEYETLKVVDDQINELTVDLSSYPQDTTMMFWFYNAEQETHLRSSIETMNNVT